MSRPPAGPPWSSRPNSRQQQQSKKHVLLLQYFCGAFNNRRSQLRLREAPPLPNGASRPHHHLPHLPAGYHLFLLPNHLVTSVFGPAIFEASKLDVMFVGVREDEHPDDVPRIYTLTHCDLTAMLTLTISTSINKAQLQGWYKRLQRDDVVAVWRRCQGDMSLHVHCHISGGHWFRDAFARLRFHIFKRELPMVLKAFRHGDGALLNKYPELEKAPVWVYFHSNVKEFDKVECWGHLAQGGQFGGQGMRQDIDDEEPAQTCRVPCDCCFPSGVVAHHGDHVRWKSLCIARLLWQPAPVFCGNTAGPHRAQGAAHTQDEDQGTSTNLRNEMFKLWKKGWD
ncbi:hypothetical protein GOP47_0027162 [Adiantum capillus-veneris]|nr:hypothetical protein GOP47_0027162 [Adiantum capillus-veneris]